jgi:hypothetical protein
MGMWLEDLGFEAISLRHVVLVTLRFLVAAALGALVAYRPWRGFLRSVPPVPPQTAQAQTLIAMAGAIMVSIIGDSQALAFGLVGLGGFIRFRSGIKDTRDAAVMFVMIGLGMACGLGLMGVALAAAGFSIVILGFFDAFGTSKPTRVKLAVTVVDPRASFPAVRELFTGARVIAVPVAASPTPGKIVLEIDARPDLDAAGVLAELEKKGVQGVTNVSFEED